MTSQPTTTESRLPRALLDPASYPERPARVEMIETHSSWIFLAGERAFKVKKAVKFPFLDFTRLDRRRHYLEEEVRLNAFLAPGVYRAVLPIVEEKGALRIASEGTAVEYALEMRRLPPHRMLDRLLDAGEVDNAMLSRLAAILEQFHAQADALQGEVGSPERIRDSIVENLQELEGLVESRARALVARVRDFAQDWISRHGDLLRERAAAGRIRDGHGDLHAGNICFEAERITIYDRLEFQPKFRHIDVAADLAFLAMDLDLRGFHAFSTFFLRSYASRARDETLLELGPLYKGHRAAIRAKVAQIRWQVERDERQREAALAHLNLAASYSLAGRPAVVLMSGLPGTGKTFVARGLASKLGAELVRSDVMRRQAAAGPGGEKAAGDRYGQEAVEANYDAMLEQARALLAEGRLVLLDATFDRRERRERARSLARDLHASLVMVVVTCDEATVRERLERRAAERTDASEADHAVYLAKQKTFEEPRQDEGVVVRHESGTSLDELLSEVLIGLTPSDG